MADPLYTELLAVANELIGQFGKPAQVERSVKSGPDYDPVFTPTLYDIKLVDTGYSITNRTNTNIQEGDIVGLVSMDGEVSTLEMSDVLIIDSKRFNFVDIMPLNPGGLQLLTEIQAR